MIRASHENKIMKIVAWKDSTVSRDSRSPLEFGKAVSMTGIAGSGSSKEKDSSMQLTETEMLAHLRNSYCSAGFGY